MFDQSFIRPIDGKYRSANTLLVIIPWRGGWEEEVVIKGTIYGVKGKIFQNFRITSSIFKVGTSTQLMKRCNSRKVTTINEVYSTIHS